MTLTSVYVLAQTPAAKPALTVKWIQPSMQLMTKTLRANGSIAPWAEASVSTEVGGHRLAQVLAEVGDSVKKGQLLAKMGTETARIEVELAKAQIAEAEAGAADAVANAERARAIEREGFYSAAQLSQIFSLEKSAIAKVRAARVKLVSAELALKETDVLAPDDGVISAKTAMLGAVVPVGAELFRLIRQGRLEWRAELTGHEIGNVRAGMTVILAGQVQGRVRMVSPTIDPASRTALAFVDIPAGQAQRMGLRAGSYARGEFALGKAVQVLSVPQSAVVFRDGFSYVFALGANNKVAQMKVQTGGQAQAGGIDWIEITQGLKSDTKIVASGAAFLADGDSVKVSQ
jgi:RND family efflux transporter MFP subunit